MVVYTWFTVRFISIAFTNSIPKDMVEHGTLYTMPLDKDANKTWDVILSIRYQTSRANFENEWMNTVHNNQPKMNGDNK